MIDVRCGDSQDILPTLPDASFDIIIADPPYGIPMWNASVYGQWLNDKDPEPNRLLTAWVVGEAARLLHPTGYLYMTLGSDIYPIAVETAWQAGFRVRPWVWLKTMATPTFPGVPWRSTLELCLFAYRKNDQKVNRRGGARNYVVANAPRYSTIDRLHPHRRVHPTQKPTELFETWLAQTPGRLLDPFCGVGSSLLAAQRLGLDAVGIDNNKDWVREAKFRLKHDPEVKYI